MSYDCGKFQVDLTSVTPVTSRDRWKCDSIVTRSDRLENGRNCFVLITQSMLGGFQVDEILLRFCHIYTCQAMSQVWHLWHWLEICHSHSSWPNLRLRTGLRGKGPWKSTFDTLVPFCQEFIQLLSNKKPRPILPPLAISMSQKPPSMTTVFDTKHLRPLSSWSDLVEILSHFHQSRDVTGVTHVTSTWDLSQL